MRAALAIAVSLTVEVMAFPARGTEADAGSPPAAEPSAEQLAARAFELHDAGKYAEAVVLYLRVYDLSGAGAALFNVATIYDRKLHERALSVEYYGRYLRAPDAEPALVEKATARIKALEHDKETDQAARRWSATAPAAPAATRAPNPEVDPAPVPPTPRAPRSLEPQETTPWRTVGFVAGGAGVAGICAGLVLGGLALVKNKDANSMCSGDTCSSEVGVELGQQAGRLATASTIAFFTGLALGGGGLALVLVSPKAGGSSSRRATSLAVSPRVGASAAGLSLRGGF